VLNNGTAGLFLPIFKVFKYLVTSKFYFSCVWRPLCMRVAATKAQLAGNKSLNKRMKTQLKNLIFYKTLVLAKAYS